MGRKDRIGRKRKGYWRKSNETGPRCSLESLPEAPTPWNKQVQGDKVMYSRTIFPTISAPLVSHSLVVTPSGEWSATIHGQVACKDRCPLLREFPNCIDCSAITALLDVLMNKVCPGNPDQEFVPLAEERKGVFKDQKGSSTTAVQDTQYPVQATDCSIGTIRSTDCELLLGSSSTSRCQPCTIHRNSLRVMLSRSTKGKGKSTNVDSHVNLRYMNTPEKISKHQNLKAAHKDTVMQDAVKRMFEQSSVTLDDSMSGEVLSLIEENKDEIGVTLPEGSPARLLWEQQKQALSAKDTKGMRWHPLIVRWCLSLKLKSPAAYRTLTESGFLVLPSERTLRDYTNYFKVRPGYQDEVDTELIRAASLAGDSSPPHQRCVILAIDEMKIHEDLVFDKHSSQLTGFVNLGDADSALRKMSTLDHEKPVLATSMLVVMIRFLFKKLDFVYASFPTVGASGVEIMSLIWEGISRLELFVGLKVLGITSDGASTNRKFYRLASSLPSIPYKAPNFFTWNNRFLYLFCDVPHLMKTVRNCWASSYVAGKKRKMWINGCEIKWQHLVDLYEDGKGACREAPGLNMLHKLTREHVYLNSYSKMKVSLAVQVLSKSVADALQLKSQPELRETERFVRMMNRFFDMLNVRSTTEGFKKRNKDLLPYTSLADDRFKWLKVDFLGYLDEWERSSSAREGFTKEEKSYMCLSQETLEGLRITVNAFLDLVNYMFTTYPGIEFFLTERLTQDPLESYFGLQRQMGGGSRAPNVNRFLTNTQSLRMHQQVAVPPRKGNVQAKTGCLDTRDPSASISLPKRKKH